MTMKETELDVKRVTLREMAENAINDNGTLIIYYWISDYQNVIEDDKDSLWIDMIYESIMKHLEEGERRTALLTLVNNCSYTDNKNKKENINTYLYILKSNETGLYKIGITKNLEQRHRAISSHENGIKLIKKYQFFSRSCALSCETTIHRKLSEKRVCGEWFREDEEIIVNIANQIVIESKARSMIK